jgi:hypothetical protein
MDWNSSLALLELPAFGLGLLQERRWFGGTEHANILIHLCLNEHYYFYFSSGAAEIAGSLVEVHGAETCSAPVRSGYRPVVVVGLPNARETQLRAGD